MVWTALALVAGLAPEVAPDFADAGRRVGWSCPAVLAHLEDPADGPDIAGLSRALVTDRWSPAVAVVAETGRTDQGLDLLRLGPPNSCPGCSTSAAWRTC